MDLSQRALQTNGFFSNFEIILRINYNFLKIFGTLGINACVKGEAFVLISSRSSLYSPPPKKKKKKNHSEDGSSLYLCIGMLHLTVIILLCGTVCENDWTCFLTTPMP